jgi:hypothetical protein
MEIECNRCGTEFKEDKDLDFLGKRADRHTLGRHTEHGVISERDGHEIHGHGMGNLDIGVVEWITHE